MDLHTRSRVLMERQVPRGRFPGESGTVCRGSGQRSELPFASGYRVQPQYGRLNAAEACRAAKHGARSSLIPRILDLRQHKLPSSGPQLGLPLSALFRVAHEYGSHADRDNPGRGRLELG